MNSSKITVLLVVLIFIGRQTYLIANEFSGTRIIEVRKEIYNNNEKGYLKNYEIVNYPFEQFDLRVRPKSFWDYLLLTNKDGNLLSLLLEISAGFCLAWWIFKLDFRYKLDYNDVFSKKNIKLFKWIFVLTIPAVWLAYSFGLTHTNDFWKNIYTIKAKGEFWEYDFYIEKKYDAVLYMLICLGFVTFIRNFELDKVSK